jgi:uncharacterized membrane protein
MIDWLFWAILCIPVALTSWLVYYLIKHKGDLTD